jgi:oligopeptide/dipeptide ABC transporter ATP-binding protein
MTEPLLSVRDLRTVFHTESDDLRAVDGVSFDVRPDEVFAIVGESGSGKTVTALSVMRLVESPPGEIIGGEVLWKGRDLLKLPDEEMRQLRGKEIAMIFQDPMTSLNPVHTIGRQIGEVVRTHEGASRKAARARAIEMLELVGIPQPQRRVDGYPHEFSGGMRQRAMIAMAIACEPQLLIADEPTTALDVTVQAQVLEVLLSIKAEIHSAILLITHDLGIVAGTADRVMVMYAGREAEGGTYEHIFSESAHPYTLGLRASLPRLDATGQESLVPIHGSPPSLRQRPTGCAFHPRCPFAVLRDPCMTEEPPLREVVVDHVSACHFAEDVAAAGVEGFRDRQRAAG